MNNYERIKAMTIEEMAEFLVETQLDILRFIPMLIPMPNKRTIERMKKGVIKGLKSEVEE